MKKILYIITLATLGCKRQTKDIVSHPSLIDTFQNLSIDSKKTNNSKYYTKEDSLFIPTELNDTLKYSKSEFNKIIDNFPALFSDAIEDPDATYYGAEIFKDIIDENGNQEHLSFNSEVGQDEYYTLYAYFLKQKNGNEKYKERRKRFIAIYGNINFLFSQFEYGGTYFTHQNARILGYAEYAVYLHKRLENSISKTYDITKQKEFYIKSLRQLIDDESKIDFNTMGKEKIKRTKELNKIVDQIDKDITDNFYLRRAQEFQYTHYQYY